MEDSPVKIITAFSNSLLRNFFFSELLYHHSGKFEVIADTAYGSELSELTKLQIPDLVILDGVLVDMGGVEAAEKLLSGNSNLKILLVSHLNDRKLELKAACLGVKGFVTANSEIGDFTQIINTILKGRKHFTIPGKEMISLNGNYKKITGTEFNYIHSVLTEKQKKVFCLIGKGWSYSKMTEELCIVPKTLDKHIWEIKKKLNFNTSSQMYCNASRYLLFLPKP